MHEISPVLAGTYDRPDYNPAVSNVSRPLNVTPNDAADATSAVSAASSVTSTTDTANDPYATGKANGVAGRKYTSFDHSAADVGDDDTFSFSDFVDMINPLQHIPVASAVYRAATGEKIDPAARIAGDIMYGALTGGASAIIGGLGAIGDTIIEAQSGGKDPTGMVVASLFGGDDGKDDSKQTTQMAGASSSPAASAFAATPAAASAAQAPAVPPVMQAANMPGVSPTLASTASTVANTSVKNATLIAQNNTTSINAAARAFPLNRAAANSGVMTTQQAQAQAMAYAQAQGMPATSMGNTIYTRLQKGTHPSPLAFNNPLIGSAATNNASNITAANAAATVTPAASTAATAMPVGGNAATQTQQALLAQQAQQTAQQAQQPQQTQTSPWATGMISPSTAAAALNDKSNSPLPTGLIDDMAALKAISQYRSTAQGPAALGANVNVSN